MTQEQLHQLLKQKSIDLKITKKIQDIDSTIRNSISMQYVNQKDLQNLVKDYEKHQNEIQEHSDEHEESELSSDDSDYSIKKKSIQQKKMQNQNKNNKNAEIIRQNQQRKLTKKQTKFAQDHILYLTIQDSDLLNDWNFDITQIESKQEKLRLTYAMFEILGLFQFLKVEKEKFYKFLLEIYDKYQKHHNPFHNFDHGFTVTHTTFYFIFNNIGTQYFKTLDKFILLLSCLGHDLEHTGKNNAFECASLSDLALKYNDDSVLENHHISTLFFILKNTETNILSNLSNDDYKYIRKMCISNILGTDMKKHFEGLKLFETKLAEFEELDQVDKNRFYQNENNMKLLQGSLVHSADLSGPSKKFEIAKSWSLNISKEFTNIVEKEKQLGLPITPYLTGLTSLEKISKEEQGFIKAIIRPLWVLIAKFDKKMQFALDNIDQNIIEWEKIHKQECEKNQK